MEYEDLIENEIYFQKSMYDFVFYYRKMSNKSIGYGKYLSKDGNFYPEINLQTHNGYEYHKVRQATPLEKAWLQECIKQGKFVTLDNVKINNNYRLWKLKIQS